jgi:putative hydrolase of the HAD superfamily
MNIRSKIKRLIFDADDTLWENNIHYIKAAEDFAELISRLGLKKKKIEQDFQILEKRVVKEKGYGGENYLFILRTLFNQYHSRHKCDKLIPQFKIICEEFEGHLHLPPKVFPEVPLILDQLQKKYPLYVLTKGDIEEQKRKLKKSLLMKYFRQTFVESEKDIGTYRRILRDNHWTANEVCMIGNSPKSDINPALRLGMFAILVPYQHTWVLEEEPLEPNQERLEIVKSFADLPSLF